MDETTITGTPSDSSETEYNPFDGVEIENGEVVFGASHGGDGDEDDGGDGGDRSAIIEACLRRYPPETLARHLAGLLGYIGRRKDLDSLQGLETDEDFRLAAGVVHRRLAGSALGPVLARLSDQAFEDFILLAVGFGPVAFAAMRETAEKKKAAKMAAALAAASGGNRDTEETEGNANER
jgi:hypothetical protein